MYGRGLALVSKKEEEGGKIIIRKREETEYKTLIVDIHKQNMIIFLAEDSTLWMLIEAVWTYEVCRKCFEHNPTLCKSCDA